MVGEAGGCADGEGVEGDGVIPNANMIEGWATETDDGYVKIPASSWPELLWVLRVAERAEDAVAGGRELIAAHERRAKDAGRWTLAEESALFQIKIAVEKITEGVRTFAA